MQLINFYYPPEQVTIYLNASTIQKFVDDGDCLRIFTSDLQFNEPGDLEPIVYSITGSDRQHVLKQLGKTVELPNLGPKATATADPYPEYPVGTKVIVNGRRYYITEYRILQFDFGSRILYTLADCEDTDKTIKLSEQQVTWYGRGNGSTFPVNGVTPRYSAGDRLWFLGEAWVIREAYLDMTGPRYLIESPEDSNRTMTISEREISPWMVNQGPEQIRQRTSEDYKFPLTVDELGY